MKEGFYWSEAVSLVKLGGGAKKDTKIRDFRKIRRYYKALKR